VLQSKFNSALISIALAFTLLISALAASYVVPARAQPITLNAVLSPDPFWGYYGGYWDMWYSMQPEFAKIGIDLQLHFVGDMYDVWELMWGPGVPEGGQEGGYPPHGWDTIMMEWWIQPQGMLWNDGIILSKNLINGPLSGYNPFPYLSRASDEFYWGMQTSFDIGTRKAYADAWQVELMHNPPVVNVYYPNIYNIRGAYFEGFDTYVWEQDIRNARINLITVQNLYDDGKLSPTAYTRLHDEKTIIYAASEAWWSYLNLYCDSYTEEEFQSLVFQTLYRMSIDPWPVDGVPVNPADYNVIPWLAASDPIDIGWFTDWDDEQAFRVRVPLREGIKWSDGHLLDAEDIVFTYNDCTLDTSLGASATGDFLPIVKRAEYIGNFTPGSPSYDGTQLDLILYEPYVDLTLILANDWGLSILPSHYFGGVAPLFTSVPNKNLQGPNGAILLPSLGPYKYLDEGTPVGYSWISFEKNPFFFGYNTSIVGSPIWGPYDIDKWIFEYVPEASARLDKLQLHEVDYAEYPTAPVEVFEGFMDNPEFIAKIDMYPSSNPLWFNFNNPALSNRYMRLALAHAIPYPDIFKDVLPSWGIMNPIPGGSFIHPWQYYGGVQLWNSEMDRYTFDLTKAQQYLDMYLYSTDPVNYALGPVGDADFDGSVDLDDLLYWLDEFGNAPYTRQIDWLDPDWYTSYPWPKSGGTVAPGNDIDPDFNNNNLVGAEDYGLWLANFGKEYPYDGAW